MAGEYHFRCKAPGCGEVVLTSRRDGKRLYPAGESRIVGVIRGDVLVECAACLSLATWFRRKPGESAERRHIRTEVLPGGSYPLAPQLIAVMEERWAAFSKAKLRERGAVASGLRFDVFMRDDFRCRYCGWSVEEGAILHADHVIPQSKGGATTLENLVTACMPCNLGKSNKDLPDTRLMHPAS